MIFSKKKKPANYTDPAKNVSSSEFEVNNWQVSEFVVEQLVPVVGMHPFPLDELMLMTAAVCRLKPGLIFEWGTNIGKSARVFYEVTKAFSIKAEIHSIDLPDDVFHGEHPKGERGKMVRGLHGVTLHQADGLTRAFEVLTQKGNPENVLFFVDGDHSFESVSRELEAILSRCPRAYVLLHDTFFQSSDSGYNTGPYDAVQSVLGKMPGKYKTVSTRLGLPGMTLVFSTDKS